ncbi:calumenin-B [Eurytemora carolleeae]|uniref:calumenin-B n=1 Tax=Eurytemora carolleeae TaxID=1294199 RepID=UPI000C76D180|nr:calumenin-B [Eurytemora carolleeae]|eukprot:XP_023347334.1 calumenin-B-like [Eurytemora affinis]
MWEEKVAEGKDQISWTEYRNLTYGALEDAENSFPIGFNYSGMIHRDERRFRMSDKDGDKELDRDEFSAFVHPEDHAYMRDIVVIETMDDMDKDKDGKISLKEYIDDFWQMYDTTAPEIEPEWVQDEREQFSLHKDTDKDGYLSFQEMKHWLVPEDFDHSWAEAHHLLSTVDADQDQKLSQEEILEKYDVFVGSQATQFGEMLNRHDEF